MTQVFDIEPTWKDIYYEVHPERRKDRSFSSGDLIRFFERNLTFYEQEEIKEYFERFCQDPPQLFEDPLIPPQLPPPIYIYLPLPFVPLPPPPPTALPPPPISLPWVIPLWPFIIPSALPPDILDFLLDSLGISEAHASEVETLKSQIETLEDVPHIKPWKSPPRLLINRLNRQIETLMSQLRDALSQNEALVTQNEALVARNDRLNNEIWQYVGSSVTRDDKIWESWLEGLEEKEEKVPEFETTLPPSAPGDQEKLNFYWLLELIDIEAERLKIDIYWKYWVVNKGITWYMFNAEGEDLEFTLYEVQEFLKYLKEIPTPDEIRI